MSRVPGLAATELLRRESVSPLPSADLDWLAGFLDAEACFQIARNNAGTSWRCEMSVALRDDDAEVLKELCAATGLGRLRPVRARGTSKPQVVWTVQDKAGCSRLVEILDTHPLWGRKSRDAWLWSEAVRLWASTQYGVAPEVLDRIARLADALRGLRGYNELLAITSMTAKRPPSLPFLGGFFTGEGSFGLSDRHARIVVKVRRDDRPLITMLARWLGVGTVIDVRTTPPSSPAVVWHVTGARDLPRVVEILDEAGLRGRKLRQYRAWRPGALEIADAVVGRRPLDVDLVGAARADLVDASAYRPDPWTRPLPPSEDERRAAYVAILRKWAAGTRSRLSCMAYADERHQDWPNRNTIAKAFGSWSAALAAAGLR